MILFFLVSALIGLFSSVYPASLEAENSVSIERERDLQKNLLSNLQANHTDRPIETTRPRTNQFNLDEATDENASCLDPTKRLRIDYRGGIVNILPFDVQQCILTFLAPQDLLITRLVSRLYCNMSNYANYMNIYHSNPDFVLKENWMNLILGNFLFKHFGNGRLNDDDLFMAVKKIVFKLNDEELTEGNNPDSLNLLSFFYEYRNGLNSSLPATLTDLSIEIIGKLAYQDLPKSMPHLDQMFEIFWKGKRMGQYDQYEIALFKEYFNETIKFIKSKPNPEEVRIHFDFYPGCSIKESLLKSFPVSFQVAFFDVILPLCDELALFVEALKMTSSAFTFSKVLYDQLNQKYPNMANMIFLGNGASLPVGQRVKYQKLPYGTVVGLDYLLSRNSKNHFCLKDLTDMSPNIPRLMTAFLPKNTRSLTEVDMILQMREAGLFSVIQDVSLLLKIELAVHGVNYI